jgi:hypothetical protein
VSPEEPGWALPTWGAIGMTNRPEVKILTQSPDRGNLIPKRQGHGSGAPDQAEREAWKSPERGCLMEVIGKQPNRTKVKRRKASCAGEPASSGEAQNLSGVHGVVATRWLRSLLALPEAFCRVPRKR